MSVTAVVLYRGCPPADIVASMTGTTHDHPHVHYPELSADIYPDDELVIDLTQSLRPRLAEIDSDDLEDRVRLTLEELAPVHVTAFLGVLVERRLRGALPRQGASSRRQDRDSSGG